MTNQFFEATVRASPASLCCGPLARHIYPSLVLVQPRKTGPCLNERLLMRYKESNQTNKLKALSHYNVLANVCRRMKYIYSTLAFAEI